MLTEALKYQSIKNAPRDGTVIKCKGSVYCVWACCHGKFKWCGNFYGSLIRLKKQPRKWTPLSEEEKELPEVKNLIKGIPLEKNTFDPFFYNEFLNQARLFAEPRNIEISIIPPYTRFDLSRDDDDFKSFCFWYCLINFQETDVRRRFNEGKHFFEKDPLAGLNRLMREIKAYPVVG